MFICLYYYRITSVFPFYFSFCDNIIECFCLSFVFFLLLRFLCLARELLLLLFSCCFLTFPLTFFLKEELLGRYLHCFCIEHTSHQCCLNLFLFSFSSVLFFFFALCLRVRTAALFSTPSTTSSFTVDLVPARRAFFPLSKSPSLHFHERPCTAAAVATQAPQQTCYTVSVAAMPAAPSRVGATNSWQLRPPQQRTILTHPPPSES